MIIIIIITAVIMMTRMMMVIVTIKDKTNLLVLKEPAQSYLQTPHVALLMYIAYLYDINIC